MPPVYTGRAQVVDIRSDVARPTASFGAGQGCRLRWQNAWVRAQRPIRSPCLFTIDDLCHRRRRGPLRHAARGWLRPVSCSEGPVRGAGPLTPRGALPTDAGSTPPATQGRRHVSSAHPTGLRSIALAPHPRPGDHLRRHAGPAGQAGYRVGMIDLTPANRRRAAHTERPSGRGGGRREILGVRWRLNLDCPTGC